MKKILVLFFIFSSLVFAIPDFENLDWGFNIEAISSFYPNLEKQFSVNPNVEKYNYFPENSKFLKFTLYLHENKLYKIEKEFNTNKIKPQDVYIIADEFTKKYDKPIHTTIDEKYSDFSIKGNKQTWKSNSTYISLIGKDQYDKNNQIKSSHLILEYGFIDPINRKDSSFDNLTLKNNYN